MFKPRQKVKIVKDQPDFNRAVSAYPHIGLCGVITADKPPAGKVAVRFKAKDLGYEGTEPLILFIWEWALCSVT